jgi:NAD(P)H-dependent flavin oxidoreductase YrpB (nitropropane dioxygenase family)
VVAVTDDAGIAITTEFTKLFKIQHPIALAGMNVAAGPKLAAAVTNAGGIGVIGGVGYTPEMLKEQVRIPSHQSHTGSNRCPSS